MTAIGNGVDILIFDPDGGRSATVASNRESLYLSSVRFSEAPFAFEAVVDA